MSATLEHGINDKNVTSRAVEMYTINPSTGEAKEGGSLWVWGQPGPQSEFQNSQGYAEKPCHKKKKKKKKNKTNY